MTSIDRLRWRCRRGMRELDIVLERFLDRRYHQLAEADQLHFVELLDQADQDILAWLLETSQPCDPVLLKLIDEIRSTSGRGVIGDATKSFRAARPTRLG